MNAGSVPHAAAHVAPTVSMRLVRALLEAVAQAGLARSQLLRAAGLAATQLDDPEARLSYAELVRICGLALDLTQDPALGLHWGERQTGSAFTPVAPLICRANSLRAELDALTSFERRLTDVSSFQLIEQGEQAWLRFRRLGGASPRVQRFFAEVMSAGFFRLLRRFSAGRVPGHVSFCHPAPAYQHEYVRVYQQAVRFDRQVTEIAFPRALLGAPSAFRDDALPEVARDLSQSGLIRVVQRGQFAERVRQILMQQRLPQRCDMQVVARSLGLSERSLRRRLAEEGTSYHQVESEAQANLAKHLLRDQQLTIHETAEAMGFSDTTTFHRAFKRWTGMTPSECQKQGQG